MGLFPRKCAHELYEIVEEEVRVFGPRFPLRMELNAEIRLSLRANSFIRAVVDVDEPWVPALRQTVTVDCITMVLARYVTAPRQQILYRLINAAMSVRQLVRGTARRERENLVP